MPGYRFLVAMLSSVLAVSSSGWLLTSCHQLFNKDTDTTRRHGNGQIHKYSWYMTTMVVVGKDA